MQDNDTLDIPHEPEFWVVDLRDKFVEQGYDEQRVQQAIDDTLARFGQPHVRTFLPLLVERGVQQVLDVA